MALSLPPPAPHLGSCGNRCIQPNPGLKSGQSHSVSQIPVHVLTSGPGGPITTLPWEFSHWSWEREFNFLTDNKVLRMNGQDTSAKVPSYAKSPSTVGGKNPRYRSKREGENGRERKLHGLVLSTTAFPLCFSGSAAELWKSTPGQDENETPVPALS